MGGHSYSPETDQLRALRHELRTPINHIVGYAELLIEEAEERQSALLADLERIHRAGGQLPALGEALLGKDREAGSPDRDVTSERFRDALNTVVGYARLLQEEATAAGEHWLLTDLDRVHGAASRLLDLVSIALASAASESPVPTTSLDAGAQLAQSGSLADGARRTTPAGGRILVVDDDAANRDLLARRLGRLGFDVTLAEDGEHCLVAIRSAPFDLVLLDVKMPGLSGFDVLRILKADERLRELPVIVLSALSETDDAARCIELGADDYLPKPFNRTILLARIDACLERKRLRDHEVDYLRRVARVTGPAAIADVLCRDPAAGIDGAAGVVAADLAALQRDLAGTLHWVELGKGETLLRQGDPSEAFFVLRFGRLEAVVEQPGEPPRRLNDVIQGDTVGEWGLLSGQPCSATIVATRDSLLARITRESFEQLAEQHPRLLTNATRDVIGRLRHAFQPPRRDATVTTIALVPLGPDVPLAQLAGSLACDLARFGDVLRLDRASLGACLGEDRAQEVLRLDSGPEAVGWLVDLEQRYRFVLYQAEPGASSWTRRCLRQADRVLLVGMASGFSAVGSFEAEITRTNTPAGHEPWELVLLHEAPQSTARGTSEWLAVRRVSAHHHVALGSVADRQRLARRLAGRAIGLALGGGGMRGAAHIGVIRALEEFGIPIDLVGGTSSGSYVAGLYALGGTPSEMHRATRELLKQNRPFAEYTLPLVALLTGRRLGNTFNKMFGDVCIEDLWRPFFAVGSNLTRAEIVVYRTGLLRRAIRASCAIPAVFPPVVENGDLIVDGSLLNNLPADIMAELCGGGPVIASDLRVKLDMATDFHFEESVSGLHLLWSRLNRLAREKPKAPSIGAVAIRSSLLGSVHAGESQAKHATFYINPPVGQFPLLDVSFSDEMYQIGYQAARDKLEQWSRDGSLASLVSPSRPDG